ncbi:hypothetical protein E4T52_15808 [Aureobasidium sp. EXF-3400]|nr:hypothetical protein E4T51_15925 [Aureobasidium sp. EXF-12344]KAI4769130.1 hypothetical protein E4T52_15808 [Aureobasidium sp. EXF-3400]
MCVRTTGLYRLCRRRSTAQGPGRIFVACLYHGSSHNQIVTASLNASKDHAQKLCEMVFAALCTSGYDFLYNTMGHVLVHAFSVQTHTLLYPFDERAIEVACICLGRTHTIPLRLHALPLGFAVSYP